MAREMNVVPYDSAWPALFERERDSLLRALGPLALEIHHFGSTAIQGMDAKPIIDVMVIIGGIDTADAATGAMQAQGYTARGENGIPGRRYFIRFKEDGENHAAHIHIYEKDNPHVADELLFRDFLRVNEAAFHRYRDVKRAAAEEYRFSPGEYVDAKTDCIREIMARARKEMRRA